VGACWAWPVAGGWVFVCAWDGCDVEDPLGDAGAVVCACGEPVEVLGDEDGGEADGVVVSGDFWVVGAEVVGGVCSVAGEVVVEFGDWANAAVAKTRPTAVLIRKRVLF
jgi:hypothetical protein